MEEQKRWWLLGLVVGFLLGLLTWFICDVNTTKNSLFLMVPSRNDDNPNPAVIKLAEDNPKGFAWHECHILGIDIETVHDWHGHLPTVRSGIPGGRLTLIVGVFVICTIAGCAMSLLQKRQVSQSNASGV